MAAPGIDQGEKLRAVAYLAKQGDKGALSLFTYWGMHALGPCSSLEFEAAGQRYFGLHLRLLVPLSGRPIASKHPHWRNKTVDSHGRVLACANLKGDDFRMLHNQVLRFVYQEICQAGQRARLEPSNLFANVHRNNLDQNANIHSGVVPDIQFFAGLQPRDDNLHTPHNANSTLTDAKGVCPGQEYFNRDPHGAVNRRQDKVNREYHNRAKKLDRDHHGTREGEIGPVEAHLNTFGNNGTVLGLVFGAFGEVSDHVRLIRDWVVNHRVTKEMQWSCVHPNVLKARHRGRFNVCLGTLIHRGWARLIIRRAYEEVLGPCASHLVAPMQGCDDGHWESVEDYRGHF